MDVKKILEEATLRAASDIFIIAGRPLTYKTKGIMNTLDNQRMAPKETFEFVTGIYALAERDITHFDKTGDDDFSFWHIPCSPLHHPVCRTRKKIWHQYQARPF